MAGLPGACSAIAFTALAAGLAAGWLVVHLGSVALRDPGTRRGGLIHALAITADLENGYLFLVGGCLDLIERWFGHTVPPTPQVRAARFFAPPSCWTAASFDGCLKVCLLSPVAGLAVAWLWSGDSGMLGGTAGLLRDAPVTLRLVALMSILVVGICFWRALDAQPRRAALWIAIALLWAGGADDMVATMDPGSLAGHHVDDGSFLGSVSLGSLALLAVRLPGVRVLGLATICMAAVAVSGNGVPVDLLAFAGVYALACLADRSRRSNSFWLWAWPVVLVALSGLLVLETLMDTPGRGRVALAFLDVMPLAIVPPVWCVWETTRWLFGQMGKQDGPGPVLVALATLLLGTTGSLMLAAGAGLAGFPCGTAPIPGWGDLSAWPGHVCVWPSDRWPLPIALPVMLPLLPAAANLVLATGGLGWWLIQDRHRAHLIHVIRGRGDTDRRSRRRILAALAIPSAASAMVGCAAVLVAGIALMRIAPGAVASLLGYVTVRP